MAAQMHASEEKEEEEKTLFLRYEGSLKYLNLYVNTEH